MLDNISIKNFALIEDLSVNFSENFNVLTGETGAGKSIIIDALSVLLGGRAQAEFIRSGTKKAFIEGTFYLPNNHTVWSFLEEIGVDCEDYVIVMNRELSLNGRNICRVNGRSLTLGQYRQLGINIVDIHGQHEHQHLLQSNKHINFLDKFGGISHLKLTKTVKEKYDKYINTKNKLNELKTSEKARLQKMDFLKYNLEEIKQANITQGEIKSLTKEVDLLANAGKISEHLNFAYLQLFAEDRGSSAYELLSKALDNLNEIKKMDSSLEKMADQLEPSLYLLEDIAIEIRNYIDNIEYSPERLEQTDKRLQLLKNLCKKYGSTIEDVLEYAHQSEDELEKLMSSSEQTKELEITLENQLNDFMTSAQYLSEARKKLAKILEMKVVNELVELAMPHTQFLVSFSSCEPTYQGLEQIEFLISPNPGEPLLPLVKIASGGELSRIMLALKTILAKIDDIGTLIFDEIDSGIGGKAAQKVAEKLELISESQQVICVTHSPFIAALADNHILLDKQTVAGRTKTVVSVLKKEDRVNEIARMLGGENPSSDLKKHAMSILKKK
ncbi:MAG: DNA repair protein RecN [Clostridia bacterium]|nr:DNA repair protein RecN [Clostridia bacterium]MDD4047844.1 DNA repair protein RecN [Clostridia bacterium]